jgi:hypothetical protein
MWFLIALVCAGMFSSADAIQCKSAAEMALSPAPQPVEPPARELARQAWMAVVAVKFGQDWANIALARDSRWSWFKVPRGFGTELVNCRFTARPCNA